MNNSNKKKNNFMDKWIRKTWRARAHTHRALFSLKTEGNLPFGKTWMNLEDTA